MAWDKKKPSLITCAKVMALPPDAVYRELQRYGRYLDGDRSGGLSFRYDTEL